MRSLAAMIRVLPSVQDILARSTFQTAASVPLGDWRDLAEATSWCAEQWEERRLNFRRSVDAEGELAHFEFLDQTHAVHFWLKFG